MMLRKSPSARPSVERVRALLDEAIQQRTHLARAMGLVSLPKPAHTLRVLRPKPNAPSNSSFRKAKLGTSSQIQVGKSSVTSSSACFDEYAAKLPTPRGADFKSAWERPSSKSHSQGRADTPERKPFRLGHLISRSGTSWLLKRSSFTSSGPNISGVHRSGIAGFRTCRNIVGTRPHIFLSLRRKPSPRIHSLG